MNLDNLLFKPEDFFTELKTRIGMDTREWVAEEANRILREKLAKAPQITGLVSEDEFFVPDYDGTPDTHRARLVCVGKIEK